MSLSIPSSFPTALYAPAIPPIAATRAQPVAVSEPFVIKLTEAEHAYQLHLQEQTVPQIANQLSITVAAVNNYLGITNST